ncbi:MAG: hypothetical protein A3C93_03805 [Candidatus Lloydbacteria bacterium RIFCSPHIGHO2_02_FULL_54_17]|uniref:TVP38/TMEM64 family membrane protein n=1 Tax=Candidatus Lloydbacteria bacterium RIFCSPHIGHO2_02_FULL_54_17 TaxID=1798664 RepID=A0A1G2DJF8_9BACT|nr:MAG: hypothetical protein A2762_00220 [Candidatus Lloydbacteria bacterium RIFCSPHIGHO2_01_FULL_54_11]OGZ13000.1 MAG: hypothetical protein A3C93_03805 [Candidatus Lloydbacteria bacterium RIFCSPHIGHO2_02_FULL_54_17]OGZ15116.1 MAG: hypothetical protein A3H76_00465 [Candidatus Lloydbacteria bacterium RIFCSPLOWO2_02_FULL_54_12]OGZ15235.1 MAG: hypothetical protein A2948_05485 [Candidatus Lloydbacteria bacterium RIFCSPLOWO2_01_FULL_54_18]
MEHLIETYKSWRYKNTALLVFSILVFFYLAETPIVERIISAMGDLGYFGSFIAGIFFVSTFTVAPASVILYHLADLLNPLGVALSAGAGAVIGDFIIFRFFKDRVFEEVAPIFRKLGDHPLLRILSTPYFAWILPVLGAFIIASPFPDEVGIGLMGISRMKSWQFLLLAFVLNSAGIFFVVTLARSL